MTRKLTFLILALFALIAGPGAEAWGQEKADTYERLTSIANIDESAQYVLGIDGTGFHYEGTSSWGKTALPSAQTPLYYTLKKAADGQSFTAQTEISNTTYYLQVPTSNTFGMATSTGTNTDLIIGTTLSNAGDGANYAVTNKSTTTRHIRRNGDSGLRSYASTTGAIAFFYKVVKDEKTLVSIAISGTPKTTYETGESFDVTDLTVTGTYSDASTGDLTDAAEWTFDPATFTSTSQTSVSVTATVDGKTATETYNVTVTAALPKITITADKIAEFTDTYAEYTWTANDVSGKCWAYRGGSSGSYNIQFNKTTYVYNTTAVPGRITSVKMTKVAGTTRSWSIYGADEALTGDNYTTAGTQIGSAQEVSSETGTTWNVPNDKNYTYFYITKADGGTNIGEIVITYEPAKTPTTIAIKTAPNQTKYYAGETFNPAGLVITATYDDESIEDIAYADHANDFTFEPSTSDALTTEDFQVTITYGGKTVNQPITVTEAPEYVVSYYSLGILLTEEQVSRGETCNAPSVTAPEGWDFVGWTENGEYLYNTTAPEPFNTLAPIEATHSLHAVFSKLVGNFENKNASVSIKDYALANDWVNNVKYLTVNVDENISVNATEKGTTGQYNENAKEWRMYQTSQNYSQWKINATNNSTLNSVIFTYNDYNYGIISYGGNTYASGSKIALSGNESSTFTVGNTGTADNGQVRITNISIAYTIGSGTRYYAINRVIDAETTISEPTTWEGKTEVYGTITVNSILTADEIINSTASNLLIEDGGQLIHHNAGVKATVLKDITAHDETSGWNFIASPITETLDPISDMVGMIPEELEGFDLYLFDQTQDYEWQNYYKHDFDIANGQGYLYANAANTTLEFAGTLYNGNGEFPLTYSDNVTFAGWNLMGNPFPCNVSLTGSYYVMNADRDEVVSATDPTIAPCEGYFAIANAPQQTVAMTKGTATSSRSTLTASISKADVRGNAQVDRAIVSFDEINALPKFNLNADNSKLYIPQDGKNYAVVFAANEGTLPLNFEVKENGTYTITVNTENIDAEYIHLIDNMTGMDTDLLSTPSYTFEAKTTDYASRFKLVFDVKNEASAGSDSNFAYMSDGNLVISDIEGQATLQIVDMMGRVVSTETVSGNFSKALNLKAGVYVLNLNGMTQKIVVE